LAAKKAKELLAAKKARETVDAMKDMVKEANILIDVKKKQLYAIRKQLEAQVLKMCQQSAEAKKSDYCLKAQTDLMAGLLRAYNKYHSLSLQANSNSNVSNASNSTEQDDNQFKNIIDPFIPYDALQYFFTIDNAIQLASDVSLLDDIVHSEDDPIAFVSTVLDFASMIPQIPGPVGAVFDVVSAFMYGECK
jgi:hypothetical protein